MKYLRAVLLLAALCVLLGLAVRWVRNELAIDRCLDQGGHWNGASRLCEGTHRASLGPLPPRTGLL